MNLILNVDSKQSKINETAVKIIFTENYNVVTAYIMRPVAYSEPYQRFKMECFAKMVKAKKLLTIFANTLLDAEIYFFTYFWYCKITDLDEKGFSLFRQAWYLISTSVTAHY